MKIAHIVEAWAGGIATYVSSLIEHQIKHGHHVTLIADDRELMIDKREVRVPIITYKSGRGLLSAFNSCKQIRKILNYGDFDIVHAHSTFPGLYTRLLANHKDNIIYTPHAWSFIKRDIGPLKRFAYRLIERKLSKKTNVIVCMSYEEINSGANAGIPSSKMKMIYTGIPEQKELVLPSYASKKESCELINVGFFGRLDYQKGYDILIKASPLLKNNIKIHIYGGAIRGDKYINNSKTSNSESIIHHGWIPHSQMNEEISKMDIIIIPSRWEGFALAPLEAMRAGKGIIVSNMSSLPEVVINGFNGIMLKETSHTEIASTLNSLSKSDCMKYAKNAKSVYEETFKQDVFMKKMDACYHA